MWLKMKSSKTHFIRGEKCIYAYAREDGDKYLYGNGKTLWDVDGAAKE